MTNKTFYEDYVDFAKAHGDLSPETLWYCVNYWMILDGVWRMTEERFEQKLNDLRDSFYRYKKTRLELEKILPSAKIPSGDGPNSYSAD